VNSENLEQLEADPYVAANPELRGYWEAAERDILLVPRCNACGKFHWHPRCLCPLCGSADLTPVEASGRGKLHSFSIIRRSARPHVLAWVRLQEGPLMMTEVVDAATEALRIGMPLQVAFRRTPQGRKAPVFRSATR